MAARPPSPMSANAAGPIDPFEYYEPASPIVGGAQAQRSVPTPAAPGATRRSASQSPERRQLRAASSSVRSGQHPLNSVKSNPALPGSRQPGSVRDIASKIDQGAHLGSHPHQFAVRNNHERYRRSPGARGAGDSVEGSPTGRSESGTAKLQKRRPGQTKSPPKSPSASFDTSGSGSSNATVISGRSQSHHPTAAGLANGTPTKHGPYMTQPLFGEVTADGNWHANFDVPGYGQLPTFERTSRRMSESGAPLGHNRSRSHQNMSSPTLSPPAQHTLNHKRSRSDMDAVLPQQAPSMPNLNARNIPALYPTPPNSGTRTTLRKDSPQSRIPISRQRPSDDSSKTSNEPPRSSSAAPRPASRNRLSKSPTRGKQAAGSTGVAPPTSSRNRYQPPSLSSVQSNQMLSAKIVAPPPKTSPPLRSSRPRQPVSSATTAASRARAAERFQGSTPKDGRKPSEQWMGKQYDPHKERTRRKIPELDKIDFAERRARIQKAISQNLEEAKPKESSSTELRKAAEQQKVKASQDHSAANSSADIPIDHKQAETLDKNTDEVFHGVSETARPSGLSLDTSGAIAHRAIARSAEPPTTGTEFDVDESPIIGRIRHSADEAAEPPSSTPAESAPILLTPATYQPPSAIGKAQIVEESQLQQQSRSFESGTLLDNVRRIRDQSLSSASREGTDFAAESRSAEDSPSDLEDRWGLNDSMTGDHGSIKIMLDDDTNARHFPESWSNASPEYFHGQDGPLDEPFQSRNPHGAGFTENGYTESPTENEPGFIQETVEITPRKRHVQEETLRPSADEPETRPEDTYQSLASDETITNALDDYETSGVIAPEMLERIGGGIVDFDRASANGGSNAILVQNLLDSINAGRQAEKAKSREQTVEVDQFGIPLVTPDTPPDADLGVGSAVVYRNDAAYNVADYEEDEDFEARIRKADDEWERQQRGEGLDVIGGAEDETRPTPPPKDEGYTPRSSVGPGSAAIGPNFPDGLRISTAAPFDMAHMRTAGDTPLSVSANDKTLAPIAAPPLPPHAPPPPPSPSGARFAHDTPDVPPMLASYSDRGSSDHSPKVQKTIWDQSGSSRPSTDSQRPPPPLPGSQSMSSFADSTRHNSIDTGMESQTKLHKSQSPGPEHKRLLKRRHIIKELLDTENSYHQDLKIVEDIYKATVADLITPDDKKILFGNCDEIERFSLHFYDELRKAAASLYVPSKQIRWGGQQRGSYSTTQSDGAAQSSMLSPDAVDVEKDQASSIGKCFQDNLQRMDQVYGTYLKNHEAANQRLSALKNAPNVKCWLEECHNNASDITSAWDLDSLLVKPTQRVSKYPMLLQQLLETTPANHPDYEALKTAAKDTINMLTRINDAKKRAEIVDQIINRKGKDSDMRSGIARAFGRRTEKLKERVGIAEVFQDADFDALAHKFGGHFIRLQICMRDVQDYLNRIDKSMEQIVSCAAALDLFTDVNSSSLPEIESKWRRYGQAVRDIAQIAFPEHKAAVSKRVVQPMVVCIKLHDGPQNAINKRKKMIVDYAKCKSIEKRGEKPDRKTIDASEKYEALNHQLKLELPKLYSLTGTLVQACLDCFLEIQTTWYDLWERKLRPTLEASDYPESIEAIEPAFRPDYDLVKNRLLDLTICNGSLLAESANFLSPTMTLASEPPEQSSAKQASTRDSSKRSLSMGIESSPTPANKRRSTGYGADAEMSRLPEEYRVRSNSSVSTKGTPLPGQTPGSSMSTGRAWTNPTPNTSFSSSRPVTSSAAANQHNAIPAAGSSADDARSPRPGSGQTYFTARPEQAESQRFSGLFSSAVPPDTAAAEASSSSRPTSRQDVAPDDTPVLFVCASLFEFSIDKTRREGGYPYLTYVSGEVFDVIAQKGELWLAKNQDDPTNMLGWIWEQHFVILSQD